MSAAHQDRDGTGGVPRHGSAARWRVPFLWGGSGFLLGAFVWHLVGFWSFVSTVVWKGPPDEVPIAVERQASARFAAPAKLPAAKPRLASVDPAACITLVMDRTTGATVSGPCPAEDTPLLKLGAAPARRTDLAPAKAPAVADWRASIEREARVSLD